MSIIQPPPAIVTTLAVGQGLAGPPGAPGPAGGTGAEYPNDVALSGHRVIALDAAGKAVYASADDPTHALRIVGVSLGAAAPATQVGVQSAGYIEHAGWTWAPDSLLYLGLGGSIESSPPPSAAFVQVLGKALSATRVHLVQQPPVFVT